MTRLQLRIRFALRATGPAVVAILLGSLSCVAILPFPPVPGAAVALAGWGTFLWLFCVRPRRAGFKRTAALLRLRALPFHPARALALLVLVMGFAVLWAAASTVWIPHAPGYHNPLDEYARRPGGWIAASVVLVGLSPTFEEFAIRGFLQRGLERAVGPVGAVAAAAFAFALLHGRLGYIPYFFVLGALLGAAVYGSGSIWTGVLLHAGFNAALAIVGNDAPGRIAARLGTPATTVLATLSLLLLCLALRVLVRPPRGRRGVRSTAAPRGG